MAPKVELSPIEDSLSVQTMIEAFMGTHAVSDPERSDTSLRAVHHLKRLMHNIQMAYDTSDDASIIASEAAYNEAHARLVAPANVPEQS